MVHMWGEVRRGAFVYRFPVSGLRREQELCEPGPKKFKYSSVNADKDRGAGTESGLPGGGEKERGMGRVRWGCVGRRAVSHFFFLLL